MWSFLVPVVGSEEETVNGCMIYQVTVPARAINSTGNSDVGPRNPATSTMYQNPPDLRILKKKYHLGEGQCFIFKLNAIALYGTGHSY